MLDLGGGDGPLEFDIESAKVPNQKNKDLLSWNQQYTKGEEWCHFRNLIMDCCNTYID